MIGPLKREKAAIELPGKEQILFQGKRHFNRHVEHPDRTTNMDSVELSLFQSRVQSICDEMGIVLKRAAFSPNIKDRLDFSCALFDRGGALFGQAAHIPVHLGSMAFAMAGIVARFEWQPGDLALLNDPFLGGTHLPDVTVVAPAFAGKRLIGFAACRAHHANIGADQPGSMPIASRLEQEGIVIAPMLAFRSGRLTAETRLLFDRIAARPHLDEVAFRGDERLGDFFAQFSAARLGAERAQVLDTRTEGGIQPAIDALNGYAERLARQALRSIAPGQYTFTDYLDDDGQGSFDIPIVATITIGQGADGCMASVDFTASAPQVAGNVNCPLSVTAAAVYYVFRCLMPQATPACAGAFRPIAIRSRPGTLVDALPPAAVAAGNVETSTRIVDVLLGALGKAMPERIPAASQGTMNNVAMGRHAPEQRWDYYETIGGGTGAHAHGPGCAALQSHMTNTMNTPVESLESHYPIRVRHYRLRRDSGGSGRHRGGEGIDREFEFLAPTMVTLLTERRRHRPWGLAGGASGAAGQNRLNGRLLPAKTAFEARPGDRLCILTPGGGGWGPADGS
jgi:N-methylhydantoinase B